ncbi:MAG: hypothetical protein ACQEXJ_09185 [Myxococcota bacterium]
MQTGLFDERPRLAEDTHLLDSDEGPLLVGPSARHALLLSDLEVGAVACMDGSLTLEAIAAKVLQRFGRVSYAGLVHLVQTLAVEGFLARPLPRLAAWPHLRWVRRLVDLPVLTLPGVGSVAPHLPDGFVTARVLLPLLVVAAALTIPHGLPMLERPDGSVLVAGSWELTVLVLLTVGFVAQALRGLARAAWLRGRTSEPPAGGLRLRSGLLGLDVAAPHLKSAPPRKRARLGRAGLLGLLLAAVAVSAGAWFLEPPYEDAASWALLPWLLIFLELCPFLPTDGERLADGQSATPEARARLTRVLLRGSWWHASLDLFRKDAKALLSLLWLLGALLLTFGPLRPAAALWASHLFASDSPALRIVGALPPIAWTAILLFGLASGIAAAIRLGLLAIEVRRGRDIGPRQAMPDEDADRVIFDLAPLAVLPDHERVEFERRLLTRVVSPGERLDGSAGGLQAVLSGVVALRVDGEDVVRFGPGDVFPCPMDLPDVPEGGSALIALTRGRLRVLQDPDMDRLLDHLPQGREALVETLLARATLRASTLFSSLHGRAVDQLVVRSEPMEVAAGEVLLAEGVEDRALYVIQTGALSPDDDPDEELRTGDVVGLDTILTGGSHSRTWRVRYDARLVRVPAPALTTTLRRAAPLGLMLETAAAHGPVFRRRRPGISPT